MAAEPVKSYRDLRVWQEAVELAEDAYRITQEFPKEEMYGMTSQIRRSSVSIAANIAEGYGRDSAGSYVHFLRNAQGSLKELETHLLLSGRVGLAATAILTPVLERCDAIGRMLRALIRSLQNAGER